MWDNIIVITTSETVWLNDMRVCFFLIAVLQGLDYFSTECIYSPNAYRGYARAYIKDLEQIRPSAILDIIHSGEVIHTTIFLFRSEINTV